MIIRFKQGSEVSKVVQELYDKKEINHAISRSIIEEVTGCKLKEGSGLGYVCTFSVNYSYSFASCYFEDGVTTVPGFTPSYDKDDRLYFRVNRRTKVYKTLKKRFGSEVKNISSRPLNKFGIYTEKEDHWYGWRLVKEEDSVVMPIHAAIYDLIDFSATPEGDITISQKQYK